MSVRRITMLALLCAALGVGATAATAGQEKAEIVLWHYQDNKAQLAVINNSIKRFNRVYPNVKVKVEFRPFAQMSQAILAAAAAKRGPDVLQYQWGDMFQINGAGGLKSMDSYFKASPIRKQVPGSVIHKINGKVYTIQSYVNLLGLYYNADILDKYDISPPTTVAQLEAAMKKIRAANDGIQPLIIDGLPGVDGWWTGMPWMRGHGVEWDMKDRARILHVLQRMRSYITSGYMSQDIVTLGQSDVMNRWLGGKAAFAVGGNWELGHLKSDAKFKWGTVPMPSDTHPADVYLGGEGLSIGGYSKNPKLAWKLIELGYFNKETQASMPRTSGSVPVRRDVASKPSVLAVPGLTAFTKSLKGGRSFPLSKQEVAAQVFFGDTWSAVLAGQISPSEGADRLVTETPKIFASK